MPVILVIDDDEMIRRMLVTAFRSDDYEVRQAADGRSGLREFSSGDVDVVITDIIMPDMEGIETIRELKRIDSEARIIAFSGGGAISPDGYLKIAENMGANYTFQKPISIKKLKAAVKDLLEDKND